MIIGLRTGWVRIERTDTAPRLVVSSTVSAIGAKTISCSSSTGAT